MYELNKQQFEDVMNEITKTKSPDNMTNCKTVFTVSDNTTIATMVYYDGKGNVIIKQGFTRKRKGDEYNVAVGQLLSSMRVSNVKSIYCANK